MECEVSQKNPPLPSALVSCAGRHEPVAAYADFFIRVSEKPAPALCCALVSCAGRHEPVAAYADFLIQVLEIKCYFNNGLQELGGESPGLKLVSTGHRSEEVQAARGVKLRYHRKEVATKAEMLSIIKDYQDLFPMILSQAINCMTLVFGIDVKALDPTGLVYVLVNTLGLTYNDSLRGDEESMPVAGLLVNTLSIIFIDGNCTSEEKIWEMLGIMGLYAGMNHSIYGDPRELLTQVWVQQGYLEYRQVPNSDPACYEFLWGPRTYSGKFSHVEANMVIQC
nr:PREDICTED: melanoma-associated antigen 10-like [Bos mutus]